MSRITLSGAPPPVIVDTNVLVSGLLSSSKEAPTARILDAMLKGELVLLLSVELLREYRQVLLRPGIQQRHRLSDKEVDALLLRIAQIGVMREPPMETSNAAPDPGDNHLWALLETQADCLLITGDRLLLENPPRGRSVLSPRSFVEWAGKP